MSYGSFFLVVFFLVGLALVLHKVDLFSIFTIDVDWFGRVKVELLFEASGKALMVSEYFSQGAESNKN